MTPYVWRQDYLGVTSWHLMCDVRKSYVWNHNVPVNVASWPLCVISWPLVWHLNPLNVTLWSPMFDAMSSYVCCHDPYVWHTDPLGVMAWPLVCDAMTYCVWRLDPLCLMSWPLFCDVYQDFPPASLQPIGIYLIEALCKPVNVVWKSVDFTLWNSLTPMMSTSSFDSFAGYYWQLSMLCLS